MRLRKCSNSIIKFCMLKLSDSSDFLYTDSYYKVQCYKKSIPIIKSLKCKYVLKQYMYFISFAKNLITILFILLFIHLYPDYSFLTFYTSVYVRLSYCFRASLIGMLSFLFLKTKQMHKSRVKICFSID